MIDEKIKYGEWCAKWYQKNKNLNIKELEDEHKSRKIEDPFYKNIHDEGIILWEK